MKKLVLILTTSILHSAFLARQSLQKLWESDSLTLKAPESALFYAKSGLLYDDKTKVLYVSSFGTNCVIA